VIYADLGRKLKQKRKKRQKQPITVKAFLIPKLRRASRFWRAKNECRNKAKVTIEDGKFKNGNIRYKTKFKCNICHQLFDAHETNVDHINPVVGIEGFTNWDDYINNMFCEVENMQLLCHSCHDAKTSIEVENRKKFKQKSKKRLTFVKKSATHK
jgi:5-methylcytosine-specific restriction endonuclease McrA